MPLIARISKKARDYYAVVISLLTTVLAFSLVIDVTSSPESFLGSSVSWISSLGIEAGVFVDPLSVLFAVLVAFFGLIISIYSLGYMKGEEGLTRYYFFFLVFIGSMIGLVISDNFLQMFVFWEMVGLCSYSLISFWYKRKESVRAGTKVFLMTRIGDIALLAAIGLLYASLGSFSFRYAIENISTVPPAILIAIAFLALGGAIAKSAQLPLHTWLYSAMEAPTSVSALLHAATMVKAGIYLIARLILIIGPLVFTIPYWLSTIAWIGVLTAFLGATLAFYTHDIKGVLAYSTVSQLGFMMAALGTISAESNLGWYASLFHMMSHAFFEGLGFLLAGGIIHALGTRDMRLMGGLKKIMPITFGLALIMIVTASGLPPFAAFFSKGLVITSISETGNILQTFLIYATTMLTFAYCLRFITLTFMGKKSEHLEKLHPHEAPRIMLAPAVVLAVLCGAWGFVGPWFGRFMGAEVEISIPGAFISSETVIFLSIIMPVGLLIYLTYYRTSATLQRIRGASNPLSPVLKHGYFFDDVYERVAGVGIVGFSAAVRRVEIDFIQRFPQLVSNSILSIARAVQKYLEVMTDQLLSLIAHRTLRSASQMKKVPSTSLQHYLAAALLGFILILILIIITIGV